jgi:tetratricopeptide (TPR) repeat protein
LGPLESGTLAFVGSAIEDPDVAELCSIAKMYLGALEDNDYWIHLGQALGSAGYHKRARYAFEMALELNPLGHTARLNLAATLSELDCTLEGIELIEKVPVGYQRRAVIYGNLLHSLRRFEKAIPYYESAIREEPDFWMPYVKLLQCLRITENAAFELWLERAIKALPSSPPIALEYCYHCFRNLKLEELADAQWIENLESGAGKNDIVGRNLEDGHSILLAKMWRLCGVIERDRSSDKLPEVIRLLDKATDPTGICDIACVLVGMTASHGQMCSLEKAYSRICSECQGNRSRIPALASCRARALLQSGDIEGAAIACESILAEDKTDILALGVYWWALDDLERVEEAIIAANELIQISPDEDNLNYNLGYLNGKIGKLESSTRHYEEQLKKSASHWESLQNLAFLMLLTQNTDRAEELESTAFYAESTAMVEDAHREARWTNVTDVEIAVSEEVSKKRRKFKALCAFAREEAGSHTFSSDLISLNQEGDVQYGAETRICSDILTVEELLMVLHDPSSGHVAAARWNLDMQQRGDHSNILERLRADLPEISSLPEKAVAALIEGERRLVSDVDHDFAPDIVSYAKSYEISLRVLAFESYRSYCQVTLDIEAETQIALQDKYKQAHKLVRFIIQGQHMELGSMVCALELCTGKTARRLSIVGRLRDYIQQQLKLSPLLDKEILTLSSDLATYRNNAAHAESYTRNDAMRVRNLVLKLLRIFG